MSQKFCVSISSFRLTISVFILITYNFPFVFPLAEVGFKPMSVLIVPRKKKKQKSPRLPQILFQAEKFHFPLFASKFDHASSLCIYLSVWLLQSTANIYRDVQRGRSHCRLSSFERLDNVWPNVFTFKG